MVLPSQVRRSIAFSSSTSFFSSFGFHFDWFHSNHTTFDAHFWHFVFRMDYHFSKLAACVKSIYLECIKHRNEENTQNDFFMIDQENTNAHKIYIKKNGYTYILKIFTFPPMVRYYYYYLFFFFAIISIFFFYFILYIAKVSLLQYIRAVH